MCYNFATFVLYLDVITLIYRENRLTSSETLLTFGIVTFAFSTILGWCYYGEKAMEYLSGKRWTLVYRGVFIVGVFFGAITLFAVVWNFADLTNALMALPNIVSLIGLSGIAAAETRKYLWEDRLDEEADPEDNPM